MNVYVEKQNGQKYVLPTLAVVACVAFFYVGVPQLINISHDGNIPILSNIVSSDFYPLEKYHSHWAKARHRFAGLSCLMVALVAVFSRQSAREWLNQKYLVPVLSHNMTWWRKTLANLVILAVVIGQVGCIVFDKEFWPFSNYFMFGGVQGPIYENVRVYGVDEAGEEIYLSDRFWPYVPGRLEIELKKSSLDLWLDTPEGEVTPNLPARVDKELHALGRWYEEKRQAGKEDGPKLTEIRVYLNSYDLDPELGNIMKPDRRRILHSVRLGVDN
ncbi:MAG: hypothetical protein AAF497_25955 [Planctomycetota bacterium]